MRPVDRSAMLNRGLVLAILTVAVPTLGGCFTQSYRQGFVIPDGALEQIPVGATQEQVLIVLGTPSTVATVDGEVFYYISQRSERTAFLPQKVVDQRVVAIYFDKSRRVQRLADYGLRDGKVFDFVSRTTPTAGRELYAINYMFRLFGKEPPTGPGGPR
jgi:outer membrane protein assembly factor BamE (lipoprotein component of BamABCDE complex)